ncbi:MAG: helix-turn-helix domain-containing protein [Bacteroidales bacterium]|nr:helix-turn-helix domain-containing protein [Bacteroidales bacterium]
MSTHTKPFSEQDAIITMIQGVAPLFQAFLECSNALQQHAKTMFAVFRDPEATDEDRYLAAATLADILYPNTHEGDKLLGLDLATAEQIAKTHHPEARAVLDQMDAEEATFAARLEKAMAARNITQTELARRIGVGQPAIANLLNRECRPQKRTVARLAEALDMAPTELWP